jgi:predicted dehydrogenase
MVDKKRVNRRNFIKTVGAIATAEAVAAPIRSTMAQESKPAVTAPSTVLGANNRLNYAIVGVGGMGGGHLNILTKDLKDENVKVVAVCDVFEKRRLKAQTVAELHSSRAYTDYRRLLENKDIDVVIIATPDHWHGQIGIEALEAGKHIYVEKPMTRDLDEAIKMWKVARRTGRLVQVGAHGCSDPKWHKGAEIIRSGKLGKLLWAQASYCRNNPKGEWNYKLEPEANQHTIDWKMWLGKAPKREFSAERYFRWRKYWDYASGIIGDLWPHRLYPLILGMDLNEFPKTVSCIGNNLINSDQGQGETREVADTTMMIAEFPSGIMINLVGSTVNERGVEDIVRGNKASVLFGGGKVLIQPERPYTDEIEQADVTPPDCGESHKKHQLNFLQAIRNNTKPSCDIEKGVRVQTIISMAELSIRKGKTMKFNAEKLKVYS